MQCYGTKLVSYIYDAWGNLNVTYHNNGGNTGAAKNSLTYRGYYYDRDIGFYYLQSRYYDPAICRFINADSYVSTGQGLIGNNMFAYCNNNPVMYVDPTGTNWERVVDWVRNLFTALFNNSSSTKKVYTINSQSGIIKCEYDGKESIQIVNSYLVKSKEEKYAILNGINEHFGFNWDDDKLNSMFIEWSAHNFCYLVCTTCVGRNEIQYLNGYLPVEVMVPWYPGEIIASLASGRDNPTKSSRSVDFSVSGGDSLEWWYDIVTLGGVISW